MRQFIADLFRGPGNKSWDLGRIIGAKAALIYPAPFIVGAIRDGTLPDAASFGTGYAAVLLTIGGLIGIKDIAVAKANSITQASDAAK